MLVLCGGRGIQLCKQRSPWKDNIKIPPFPSFLGSSWEGRGVESGTGGMFVEDPSGLGSALYSPTAPRFSLQPQIALTPSVCPSTWVKTDRQQDRLPPCRAEGQEPSEHRASFSQLFLSLPADSGGELRWGLLWMVGLGILSCAENKQRWLQAFPLAALWALLEASLYSQQLLLCVPTHVHAKSTRTFFPARWRAGRCQDLLTLSFQRSLTFFLLAGQHLSLFLQPGNSRGPSLCPFSTEGP